MWKTWSCLLVGWNACHALNCHARPRVAYIGQGGLTYYTGIYHGLGAWTTTAKFCHSTHDYECWRGLDAVVIGFMDHADFRRFNFSHPDLAPYRRSGRLGCFINKEYANLQPKLEKIHAARCSVGFSAHSNASLFSADVPFLYRPFAVNPEMFGSVDGTCVLAAAEAFDPRGTSPYWTATEYFGEEMARRSGCPPPPSPSKAYAYDFGFTGVVIAPGWQITRSSTGC